jgi:bifunctional non-homologous end joining protein LigD
MSGKKTSDPLADYNTRRDFSRTAEPRGKRTRSRKTNLRYLIQKHDARRLHYDLRLEWDGVLKSWAVTKGPSLDPTQKRLAVRTEDHPLSYGDFEGTIPKDEYGGGTVMMWDTGTWEPIDDPAKGFEEGKFHFILHGERLGGEWILVRMAPKKGERRENWLLMKARDDVAAERGREVTARHTKSVTTGRTMREIASDAPAKSKSPAATGPKTAAKQAAKSRATPPRFVKPQLAHLVSDAPDGEDWLNEVKFDGYRCLVAVGGGTARCYTRSSLDWTEKFASVAEACANLDCRSALIDGEVVAADSSATSQFSALQKALKSGGGLRYYAFDLLSLDGEDLRKKPLIERKERLAGLIESLNGSRTVQYSEHVRGNGQRVLDAICQAGQEGIIAKKADAPYAGRRNGDWLKIKCTRRQEFVIGGYSPSDKPGRPFASLLLGNFENGRLRYRGRVGTGFSEQTMENVAGALSGAERKTKPFDAVPGDIARDARWVTPKLVAEVDYAEFTSDGHVRHGVFLGLRDDKEAGDVTLETSKTGSPKDTNRIFGITISSPDRVVFPQQGLTKLELARYYEAVSERMLPDVGNRLLSLVRCPQGRRKSCFYQKHASDGFPDEIRRMEIRESSGEKDDYLYVSDSAGLISAVQMGTLEFHVWWSRIDALERPDRLVFDLDPDEGLSFDRVRAAAFETRDRLADLGLNSLAMVTGGKGIHVVVPLVRRTDAEDAGAFAERFARSVAGEEPERYTAAMSKAKRKNRIFIDWLRNRRGATAIAPYSTRAREGAPVATPVSWAELKSLKAANTFRVADVLSRLKDGDPWAEANDWRQSITVRMRDALR